MEGRQLASRALAAFLIGTALVVAQQVLPALSVCCLAAGPERLTSGQPGDPFQNTRAAMVRDQIQGRGVTAPTVLAAMTRVPRHLFVPEQARLRAYEDTPLPIGYGQTISQPYIVGYMTEILNLKPHHRVLEIGTGSGYQAAVLAELAAEVYTVEIIPELATRAAGRLRSLSSPKITVRQADGYFGWSDKAPFDAIMVTAAAEFIPPPLLAQLKDGGRMIIPVGTPYLVQNLMLVEKIHGEITTRSLMPVRFVPLRRTR